MVTLDDIVKQREHVQSLYAQSREMHKRAAQEHERLKEMQYTFNDERGEGGDEDADEEP